jgi:hypothetical protein
VSAICLAALATSAVGARAGTWMQVSCVNPSGSAAPSEGWTDGTSGPTDPWGLVNTRCAPGTPMMAELADLSPAPPNSAEYLQYTPPAGSTLVGGSVDTTLSADGFGTTSSGGSAVAYARLYEPALINDPSDNFEQCVAFFQTCGPSPDFSGTVALPADRTGDFFAEAGCTSGNGTSCDTNSHNGAFALVRIAGAHFLLASDVSPAGSGFSGSALQPGARGTAHLVFTAAESTGPGIYAVTVAIDGRAAWSGTPNANGGQCVPVGTDTSRALMFDAQQPCLTSEGVDVPVPTAGLPDGAHELAVTVADAAGNQATVLDQTITTSNPQTTPSPRGSRAIHARFVISWRWSGRTTVLRSITARGLPRRGAIAVRCAGKRCPGLSPARASDARAGRLLRGLAGRRFSAGDRVQIAVTERGHRAERIELAFRAGREPLVRLRSG